MIIAQRKSMERVLKVNQGPQNGQGRWQLRISVQKHLRSRLILISFEKTGLVEESKQQPDCK